MPAPLKVRGTCKSGHVTEATAAPGRVTWQGKCADSGCDLSVNCRRVPKDRAGDGAGAKDANDPYRVIRVDSYGRNSGHPNAGDGIIVDPGTNSGDGAPAGSGPADGGGEPGGTGEPVVDPIDVDHEPTGGQRLRERFKRRRTVGDATGSVRGSSIDWDHPLGI